MRLFSWNVNGIRAALRKGFLTFIEDYKPDVLCLQEIKASPDQVDLTLDGYHLYWNPAEKKGYSGTATFARLAPLSVQYGMDRSEHDGEGRLLTLEYQNFYLVNVYAPNATR